MAPVDEIKTENLQSEKAINSVDNNGETQDVITDTSGELSNLQNNTIDTSLTSLSEKAKIKTERKELRNERRDDKQLNRLMSRLNKEIEKTSISKQELNKTTFKTDLLKMNLEDLRNFNEYLMKVKNKEIDPAKEKFKPQNLESFVSLLSQYPYAKGYIDFGATSKSDIKLGNSNNGSEVYVQSDKNTRSKAGSVMNKIDTSDDETLGEAYKEHGLRGLIKKSFDYSPNMTENQKDLRTNALFLGGVGFALFKLGKWFFTGAKNEKGDKVGPGFRGRLAILGGVALGSNVLTGKSPIELIDKALNGGMSREYLKGERGKGADEAKKIDKQEYVYPLAASTIFGKTKIADLGNLLNDNFKIKDYDILLQKAKAEGNQKVVDMLNRIGKDDKENQIKQGLEQMGIKKDNLTTFGEKTVDDVYDTYDLNSGKALKYRTDNNLIRSEDPEKIKEYNDLISSGKEITDEDMKKLVETGVLYEQFEIKKDSNREALKNKINKLEDGKSLKIKIGDDDAELSKINGISEVELKSKNGNITKINLGVDGPSIIGLGDGGNRKFLDKDNNSDFYSAITSAHKLNGFKNAYSNRKVAAGNTAFTFENKKIYFNEAKTGTTEINKVEVMNDGILGLMTDFPDVFKGQEQQIVDYLNKEINTQNQALEEVIKTFNSKNIQMELVGGDLKSHGETTKIDITNKKIIGLDDTNGTGPNRQFKNYSELIGGANLINFFKKFLRNRPAQSTEGPIYIGTDGNIAFNDRTILQEMKSYANRGANGFGDSDLIQSGEVFFRKTDSLRNISPTLYNNRVEFVHRLNDNGTFQEKITEATDRDKLKDKVNNLSTGNQLKISIGGDDVRLEKKNGLSEVSVFSKEGQVTVVNLEKASIEGLGYTATPGGSTIVDKNFRDDRGHNNYHELLVTATALNNIKNKYQDKIYAAGISAPGKNPGFKYESKDKKIYFYDSKEGGGIVRQEVMDDGFLISDFPKSFEGQENQIVTYLNNKVLINPETPARTIEYFVSRGIDVKLVSGDSGTEIESYGKRTKIDLVNKKLDSLGWQFQNHFELIGAANLVNLVSKILKDKSAVSKDGVYVGLDGNIAFNDKTIFEEMKTYFNEGLHGYGDTDLIQGGDLIFWKKNTLKDISPTLAANRREFVNYLNNKGIYNAETRQLQEKKARIEKALNNGMRTPISFKENISAIPNIPAGMSYDENAKELTITAITEETLSNDQMVNNNLGAVENFVSRYNILKSEDVKKIILPNINLEPGNAVSVKYLKKLLDLDENKIQLGPDFLANREMIEFVAKKYDEGKFMKEENSKIDMNGIITLKYIYDSGYDFNRLFNGEDDSRVDFAMRVMELLAGHRTIVDPTRKSIVELDKNIVKTPIKLPAGDDPIMKIRRVSKGENVDFGFSKNRQRRKNADNIDIMNKIIENIHRYATQNPPIENVPYIKPARS